MSNIPTNLDECFAALKEMLDQSDPKEKAAIRGGDEKIMSHYHHTLGRWIRNNWGLWEGGSELAKWFNSIGIEHADDMSGIILDSFWRHLHDKPLDIEGQVAHYQAYWARMKAGVEQQTGG